MNVYKKVHLDLRIMSGRIINRGARAGRMRRSVENEIRPITLDAAEDSHLKLTDPGTPRKKKPSRLDSAQPRNWTIVKLKAELGKNVLSLRLLHPIKH
jgi:hypothetical protein